MKSTLPHQSATSHLLHENPATVFTPTLLPSTEWPVAPTYRTHNSFFNCHDYGQFNGQFEIVYE
ncbi:MAG: hypothetical protein OEY56_07740 [Cyclobacteriaceae bacterium]|nr:hypothetical protein [Cyclobacteriaceae bacterium]